MNSDIAVLVTLIMLTVTTAGCAGSPAERPPTPAPTEEIQTPPETGIPSLSPGPTQTMPPGSEVEVTVSRDPIRPTITVSFAGGMGQSRVDDILVRVTRSDGKVITAHLENRLDSSVTVEGTREHDRLEVIVRLNTGRSYRIYDQLLKFRSHP
ncbi:MAG: hypothetical protein ACXQTN_04235 [Methanoculleaceae archaeon]